jgi:hypothetical protein
MIHVDPLIISNIDSLKNPKFSVVRMPFSILHDE